VADILISKTQQSQNPSKREAMIKKTAPRMTGRGGGGGTGRGRHNKCNYFNTYDKLL